MPSSPHFGTRFRSILPSLLVLFAVAISAAPLAAFDNTKNATVNDFAVIPETVPNIPARLFIPSDYATNPGKSYPLVLFLHGLGARQNNAGANNEAQLIMDGKPPLRLANSDVQAAHDGFFVLAPQLDVGDWGWEAENLCNYVRSSLTQTYRIDPDRIYVTGLSLGGEGSYAFLTKDPDLFAAAAPVSGKNSRSNAPIYKHIPIWNFHGANDGHGSHGVGESDGLIKAIRAVGGRPIYTRWPGGGHSQSFWEDVYSHQAMVGWMLSQSKGQPDPSLFEISIDGYADSFSHASPTISLSGTASTSYADQTIVRVEYRKMEPWGHLSAAIPVQGTANWSVDDVPLVEGENTIVLIAVAANETSYSRTLSIFHDPNGGGPSNTAPEAIPGEYAPLTLPTDTVQLNGSYNDDGNPAGGTVTAAWSQVSGPGTVVFGDAASFASSATFPAEGTYTLELTVSDGELSDGAQVAITVYPENAETWQGEDIGSAQAVGNSTYDAASDSFTLSGTGKLVPWEREEGFFFLSQIRTGDFTLIAEVSQVDRPSGHWHGQTNLSARASLATTSAGIHATLGKYVNDAKAYHRFEDGNEVVQTAYESFSLEETLTDQPATRWARIDRDGDDFTVSFSDDGQNWLVSHQFFATALPESLYVGMGVNSQSTTGEICSADFTQVYLGDPLAPVNGGGGNIAPVVDAGADSSAPAPQVSIALSGSVTDATLPNGPLSLQWSVLSGPGNASFSDIMSPVSDVSFDTAGTYVLRLTANDGEFSDFDDVAVTVSAGAAGGSLLLTSGNIGAGSGSTSFSGGLFTLEGSGRVASWSSSDSLHFAYLEVSGDFDMRARVQHDPINVLNSGEPGSLMVRESLDPASRYVAIMKTRSFGIDSYWRTTAEHDFERYYTTMPPEYIRLERTGGMIHSYHSVDGQSWTLLKSVTDELPTTVLLGLGAHSGDISNTVELEFSEVTNNGQPFGQSALTFIDELTGSAVGQGSGSLTTAGDVATLQGQGRVATWSGADSLFFAHTQVTGDFDLRARVQHDAANILNSGEPGSLMARESVAAGSRYVATMKTRSFGIESYWRTTAEHDYERYYTTTPPEYIRLERSGGMFHSYYSFDGQSWTHLKSVTDELPATVLVGLGAHSSDVSNTIELEFSEVTLD